MLHARMPPPSIWMPRTEMSHTFEEQISLKKQREGEESLEDRSWEMILTNGRERLQQGKQWIRSAPLSDQHFVTVTHPFARCHPMPSQRYVTYWPGTAVVNRVIRPAGVARGKTVVEGIVYVSLVKGGGRGYGGKGGGGGMGFERQRWLWRRIPRFTSKPLSFLRNSSQSFLMLWLPVCISSAVTLPFPLPLLHMYCIYLTTDTNKRCGQIFFLRTRQWMIKIWKFQDDNEKQTTISTREESLIRNHHTEKTESESAIISHVYNAQWLNINA